MVGETSSEGSCCVLQVVKVPSTQLLSIHAFLHKDSEIKQQPLCFVYMSGREHGNYTAELCKVFELLPPLLEMEESQRWLSPSRLRL